MIKVSPFVMGLMYFAMGSIFTYLATKFATPTLWNFPTIFLALMATLDFGLAIRLFTFQYKIKKES
ncbi:YdiK family protein [Priestia taiwanensis]|uniref:DUF4305 domain-containing protein n=1 Tax=Priestia taiwanensis TaxID=1347902 RepID=A0A917AY20_9BACI|nr:YdiK family protein [Priestia taiwanensis]MBM7365310.1 hypothetical protein [Priestia taiwanensis]GGE86060.1 hypothetical protein GCM10007140_39310 [Priestia taiwanensis]